VPSAMPAFAALYGAIAFSSSQPALAPESLTGSWASGTSSNTVFCSPFGAWKQENSLDLQVDANGGVLATVGWRGDPRNNDPDRQWHYNYFGGLVDLASGQIELVIAGSSDEPQWLWDLSGTFTVKGGEVTLKYINKGRKGTGGVFVRMGSLNKVSDEPLQRLPGIADLEPSEAAAP